MPVVLETVSLERRFGGIVAVNDLSLRIEKGARHALIGPNGAGKTTVINLLHRRAAPDAPAASCSKARTSPRSSRTTACISGSPAPSRSTSCSSTSPRSRPSGSRSRSAWAPAGNGGGWSAAIPSWSRRSWRSSSRFHLTDVMYERTGRLPYGKQRLLEIALAIACRPRVLLLDEPAAGVPEAERHEILATVAALPADVTVLLIEHDMDIVFSFADRISVLVNGSAVRRRRARRGGARSARQGGLSRRVARCLSSSPSSG